MKWLEIAGLVKIRSFVTRLLHPSPPMLGNGQAGDACAKTIVQTSSEKAMGYFFESTQYCCIPAHGGAGGIHVWVKEFQCRLGTIELGHGSHVHRELQVLLGGF